MKAFINLNTLTIIGLTVLINLIIDIITLVSMILLIGLIVLALIGLITLIESATTTNIEEVALHLSGLKCWHSND